MRIVVTGASGQLGTECVRAWRAWHDDDVVALDRAALDVTDERAVHDALAAARPDAVVHTAAWTDVDGCESDPDRAFAVNGTGAGNVAAACAAVGARMVHVSTDYVHGGDAPVDDSGHRRPWREDDPVAPLSVYGRSKLAGEEAVRDHLDAHHIVRTAWVCGAHGGNFVRTMLRVGRGGGPVRVVDDQHGSPTFTADLAVALRELCDRDDHGTWNRTNAGRATWFELARATFALAGMDVDLGPQPSSALDRPAPRPTWSVLDDGRSRAAGLAQLPDWQDGLAALLAELEAAR